MSRFTEKTTPQIIQNSFRVALVQWRVLFVAVALVSLCASMTGCGGRSRLSASEYRSRLAKIGQEVNKAQADVEKALHAKSVGEIRTHLSSFADAEQRFGDEVAKLKPPTDAEAANAQLARGEHDLAGEVRSLAAQLAKVNSAKAALSILNKGPNPHGAREVDGALDKLKKLGYTKAGG